MINLKYFINKPCTIFTSPINRDFKQENPATYPTPLMEYFVGIVEEVSSNGLLLKRMNGRVKTFFNNDYIIAIAEEEILDPVKDAEVINEYKEIREKAKIDITNGNYLDPNKLSGLAKFNGS